MTTTAFADLSAPTPDFDDVTRRHESLRSALESAADVDAACALVDDWDAVRREYETWSNLVDLRFNQDTKDEAIKAARTHRDELAPRWTELEVAMKRVLLGHPLRDAIAERIGAQAFSLWETDVLAFDPALRDDLVTEAKLEAEYTELLAGGELTVQGERVNLSTIRPFREHKDRDVRHEAEQVLWGWFGDNAEALDRIYDEMVRLRTKMAKQLGYDSFVELGYKRMLRIDYDRHDVERFREQVREHVVPLATELVRQQGERLGVEKMMAWDESIADPDGNPRPQGDHDWMIARATEMFDAMGDDLGGFFRRLSEGGYIDLKSRDGKAGGGFCTNFPAVGMPFIFANFDGTKGDVEVFTHEVGHAFQCYLSRHHRPLDYGWPTMEACEIHSMGLEFLTWPQMERFFGDDADRFRRIHLAEGLKFLPYGVAVDHFQHEVYDNPDATPAERKAMWRRMEQTYMPWRDWGDCAYGAAGGRWQLQRHIYLMPFYYIDYTLAQTCALQFLERARTDRASAMADYVALCRRGGEAPFQDLARGAGLESPFDDGCLAGVVNEARSVLGV